MANFLVRGMTKDGVEVFYTGRAGDVFVNKNKDEAFDYHTLEGAQRVAMRFNEITSVHGIHFIALKQSENAFES